MPKTHTGLPVSGYQSQSDEAVAAVNRNKVLEEMALRAIERSEQEINGIDPRALAIAKTKMQEAFMWFNRAIFQPKRLSGDLPIDVTLYFDEGVTYEHDEHGTILLFPFDGTQTSAEFLTSKHSSVVFHSLKEANMGEIVVSVPCIDGGNVTLNAGDYLGITRSGRAIAMPKSSVLMP